MAAIGDIPQTVLQKIYDLIVGGTRRVSTWEHGLPLLAVDREWRQQWLATVYGYAFVGHAPIRRVYTPAEIEERPFLSAQNSNILLIGVQEAFEYVHTVHVDLAGVEEHSRLVSLLRYPCDLYQDYDVSWSNVRTLEFCDFSCRAQYPSRVVDFSWTRQAACQYKDTFPRVTCVRVGRQTFDIQGFIHWIFHYYYSQLDGLDYRFSVFVYPVNTRLQLTSLDICVRQHNHNLLARITAPMLRRLRLLEIPQGFTWGALCIANCQPLAFDRLKKLTLEFLAPDFILPPLRNLPQNASARFPQLEELRIREFKENALIFSGMQCPAHLSYLEYTGDSTGISRLCNSGIRHIEWVDMFSFIVDESLNERGTLTIGGGVMKADQFALSDTLLLVQRMPGLTYVIINEYKIDDSLAQSAGIYARLALRQMVHPFHTSIKAIALTGSNQCRWIYNVAINMALRIPSLRILMVDECGDEMVEGLRRCMALYIPHHPHLRQLQIHPYFC